MCILTSDVHRFIGHCLIPLDPSLDILLILNFFVGSCNISPYEMPATWYDHTSKISRQKTMEKEPWRQNILANLVNNNFHAKSYVTYEDAIERSSWSKKAIVTFNLGEGGRKFEQVHTN